MKKKLILILFICSYLTNFSQNEIQKLIYDDLILMNQFYNHCILQNNQHIFVCNGNDTLEINETIEHISNHPEDVVSIVEIDSSDKPWYFIKVEFLLNGNFNFFELFRTTFQYILYKITQKIFLCCTNKYSVIEY